jgi:hypothetical protein
MEFEQGDNMNDQQSSRTCDARDSSSVVPSAVIAQSRDPLLTR